MLLADKGIAIAMGTGVAAEISAYASAEAPAEGPLASMSFDYGKLMSMIGQMPDADPMMKSMGEQFASLGMTTMQLGVSDAGIDLTFKMVLQKK